MANRSFLVHIYKLGIATNATLDMGTIYSALDVAHYKLMDLGHGYFTSSFHPNYVSQAIMRRRLSYKKIFLDVAHSLFFVSPAKMESLMACAPK